MKLLLSGQQKLVMLRIRSGVSGAALRSDGVGVLCCSALGHFSYLAGVRCEMPARRREAL